MSTLTPPDCGCPTAGLIAVDEQRHAAYHTEIGGPATCLRLCWCGRCGQYAEQKRLTGLLREQEYAARDRREGERAAARARRTAA